MTWTKFQFILALLLVVTGSINVLSLKWANKMEGATTTGEQKEFNHPYVQATCMFLGEIYCMIYFKILYYFLWKKHDGSEDEYNLTKGAREFHPFILYPPAFFDMFATSLMYIGLNITYASSFQMLRGAVIIFVGIMSIFILKRMLNIRQWLGIFFVIVGLTVVGVTDIIFSPPPEAKNISDIILGDCIIVGAQILSACQMVYEEKYVTNKDIPSLQAIGWEGIFGFFTMVLVLVPFYFINVSPPLGSPSSHRLEDIVEAFTQMGDNNLIIVAIIGNTISVSIFSYSGISITKEMNALTRKVLDSFRTLVIWMVSIAVQWQEFHWLQLIGFIILIIGMMLYNDVMVIETIKKMSLVRKKDEDNTKVNEEK